MRRSSSGASMSDAVWDRSGAHEIGERLYVGLLNFWVLLGLVVSAGGAYASQGWVPGWWMLIMLIPFAGVFISLGSQNPIVSLFGYALIVVPFGLVTGPIVASYTAASVFKVVAVTALVSGSLGTVGMVFPDLLKGWGSFLFAGLSLLIFGQFFGIIAMMFGVPVEGAFTLFDWFGAFLFSAYIVYDYGRAMRVARTVDNSIDCAVAIYLDIFNLFLKILSIMGKRKD